MNIQKVMLSVSLFILRLAIVILVAVGIYRLGTYAYTCGYSIVSDAAVEPGPGRPSDCTAGYALLNPSD